MSSKAGKRLAPELRFPEFRDDPGWKVHTLQQLAVLIENRAGSGKYTLLSVTSGVGLVTQVEKFGREIAGDQYKNYFVIKRGDFAYNKSSTTRDPEGFIALLEDHDEGAVPNSIFTCFRLTNDRDSPQFFKQLFSTNIHGKWLRKFITIGARINGSLNIDSRDLFSLPLGRPSEFEQQRIADCLSTIDDLITAQTQKIEAFKAYKKGLMQRLFPAEGETKPRLRFPEFRKAGAWEEKKAGNLFANRVERGEAGLPIYSVTINDGMIKRSMLDRDFDDIAEPEGNKKAHKHDLAYNMMRMWQGASGVAAEDCMISPAYIVLAPRKEVNSVFFGNLLRLPRYLQRLRSHSRGLTLDRLRLYYKDFAEILLMYPSAQEQKKIADCLFSIDELISVHVKKLEALKAQKQGLVQGLFPLMSEAEG